MTTGKTTPLGELLRKARVDKDWTTLQLSKASGVPRGYIAKLESSPWSIADESMLSKVATALGLDADVMVARLRANKRIRGLSYKELATKNKEKMKGEGA